MDAAKVLIRTAVRTFYSTKHILVIDALMIHSVLHADELSILLSSQPKDVRRLVGPLRAARILHTHGRTEAKVGSTRGTTREYYYIPFHIAIDAIKYRVMKLKRKIEELYQVDAVRKDWRCPVCKAEYDELEVLDSVNSECFACHRCGNTLVPTEQAAEPSGGHEKIKRLNMQLQKLEDLIDSVDQQKIPANAFEDAWESKKEVPREKAAHISNQYITLRSNQSKARNVAEHTDANALNINLTSGAEQAAEEEVKKEQRKAELAKQNQLPVWHTASAVAGNIPGIKAGDTVVANGNALKNYEEDEKKPELAMQDELEAYLVEMRREKEEAAKRAAEEDAEDDDDDEEEEEDFEDVVSTTGLGTPIPGLSTPASSQVASTNGVKRELEYDSGVSSDANTPAAPTPAGDVTAERDTKRVKFENERDGSNVRGAPLGAPGDGDSDEEEDFEDAM